MHGFAFLQEPSGGVDSGHFKYFVTRQGRQDARERTRKHGLAGAGRPVEDDVMPPGRGYFERTLSALLALNISEVERHRRYRRAHIAGTWRQELLPLYVRDELTKVLRSVHNHIFS